VPTPNATIRNFLVAVTPCRADRVVVAEGRTRAGRSAQSDRSSVSPTRDRVGALGTRISALQMGIEVRLLPPSRARRVPWTSRS
jgi:hypothetical protein